LIKNQNLGQRNILKMDIEGHEWRIIDLVKDEILVQFDQIIFELHRVYEAENLELRLRVLKKLNKYYYLVHNHKNSFNPY